MYTCKYPTLIMHTGGTVSQKSKKGVKAYCTRLTKCVRPRLHWTEQGF